MEKAVTYSVVGRKNPGDKGAPMKYYAQAQARGVMGIREIAERIQRECTVTRADTMAVLTALEDVVSEGLQSGEIVRLGELGSAPAGTERQGSGSGRGIPCRADREGAHQLRPGLTLQDALANLSYERVPVKKTAEAGEEEEGGGMGV